jgi:hypothetical protein
MGYSTHGISRSIQSSKSFFADATFRAASMENKIELKFEHELINPCHAPRYVLAGNT